jgi:hypothetical protein
MVGHPLYEIAIDEERTTLNTFLDEIEKLYRKLGMEIEVGDNQRVYCLDTAFEGDGCRRILNAIAQSPLRSVSPCQPNEASNCMASQTAIALRSVWRPSTALPPTPEMLGWGTGCVKTGTALCRCIAVEQGHPPCSAWFSTMPPPISI